LDHVTLAWDQDDNYVSLIKGVFIGDGQHFMIVQMDIVPSEN